MRNFLILIAMGVLFAGCATEGEIEPVGAFPSLDALSAEVLALRLEVDVLTGTVADLETEVVLTEEFADGRPLGAVVEDMYGEIQGQISSIESVLAVSSFATYHSVDSSVEGCSVPYGESSLWYASTGIVAHTPCVILVDSNNDTNYWTIAQFSEFETCDDAEGSSDQIFIIDGEIQIQAGYEDTAPWWEMMSVAVVPLT